MNISCIDGSAVIDLSDSLFDVGYNESLVHQLVVAYAAGGRQGTHAQKTRSMVSGGGRKPWKQKGTGRARAGTNRSPLWRGGGKVFAKTTRDYSQKINKKMYKTAVQSIFSELLRQQRLVFVGSQSLVLAEPKTKEFIRSLGSFLGDGLTTVIVHTVNVNLELATRNLPDVVVRTVSSIDPVALVHSSKVIMEEGAVKELESRWQ